MMLCEVFAKELVQGATMRRSVREKVFQELSRQGGGEALRSCASDLGKVFVDAAERGRARPSMPASLQMASEDPNPMDSASQPIKRATTPYRWSTPSLSSVGSARLDDKRIDFSQSRLDNVAHHPATWPAPNIGRQITLPVDRHPEMSVSIGNAASNLESVPVLPNKHMQKKSRLEETLEKMRRVKADPGVHLRKCPIQMGVPAQLTSTYMAQSTEPIQKAMDPKWSTELRKIDVKVGKKLKYETRLSAGGTTLCPELRHYPKDY
jgi:hypothetical protein